MSVPPPSTEASAASELQWRVRDARHADSVYAPAQAALQWQRVITLWDDGGGQVAASIDRADAYFQATKAFEYAGDEARAAALAEEALTRLIERVDDATKTRPLHQAGFWRGTTSPAWGEETLQRAIDIGATLPPTRDYVHALRRLALVRHWQTGDRRQLGEHLSQALEAAERLDLRDQQKLPMAELPGRRGELSDDAQALEEIDRILDFAVEPAAPMGELIVRVGLTETLLKRGHLDRVVDIGRPFLGYAAEHGYANAFATVILLCNVVEALRELGRIDEAPSEASRNTVEPVSRSSAPA